MVPHTRDPACLMASDERKLSPSRVSHGRTSVRSPDQEALCCLLPQRPRSASVPASWNRHLESRPSGAASFSLTPSGRGPQRPAARAQQPVATFGPLLPLPELLQWDLWLRPNDAKIVREPQLLIRLQLTQDREARQWRGDQPQVPARSQGKQTGWCAPGSSARRPGDWPLGQVWRLTGAFLISLV